LRGFETGKKEGSYWRSRLAKQGGTVRYKAYGEYQLNSMPFGDKEGLPERENALGREGRAKSTVRKKGRQKKLRNQTSLKLPSQCEKKERGAPGVSHRSKEKQTKTFGR